MCYGKGCDVSFDAVTFTDCTLVVAAGAHATLHSCSLSPGSSTPQAVALFAHGPGTGIRMHGGSITGCMHGVTVQEGAHCTVSSATITQCHVVGAEVKDHRSSLELSGCDLRQFPSSHAHDTVVRGVYAHSGGALQLQSTTVSSVQYGVVARTGAQVTMDDSTISNTCNTCITFTGGAHGKVTSCNVLWSKTRHGVHVEGSGSSVEASKCKFVQHTDSGIFAQNNGNVTAHACKTSGSQAAGYSAESGACMDLTECSSDSDFRGCAVSTGATLRASHVVISDSTEEGAAVRKGGVGSLDDCSIKRCGEQGVWATGSGSVLSMHACTVMDAQLSCVALMHGAQGQLQGCTLQGSATRSGVVAENESTVLYLEGCALRDNAQCGVLATDQAAVMASGCECEGNSGSSGFSSQCRAKVTVRDSCMHEKCGVGVFDGGRLSAVNVTMDGSVRRSFTL